MAPSSFKKTAFTPPLRRNPRQQRQQGEAVLRWFGAFLPTPWERRRGAASGDNKRLFNQVALDGTYDAWVQGYPDVAPLLDRGGSGPLVPLAGVFFPLAPLLLSFGFA